MISKPTRFSAFSIASAAVLVAATLLLATTSTKITAAQAAEVREGLEMMSAMADFLGDVAVGGAYSPSSLCSRRRQRQLQRQQSSSSSSSSSSSGDADGRTDDDDKSGGGSNNNVDSNGVGGPCYSGIAKRLMDHLFEERHDLLSEQVLDEMASVLLRHELMVPLFEGLHNQTESERRRRQQQQQQEGGGAGGTKPRRRDQKVALNRIVADLSNPYNETERQYQHVEGGGNVGLLMI